MFKGVAIAYFVVLIAYSVSHAQETAPAPDMFQKTEFKPINPGNTYTPLTLNLDESGQKFIRFINWNQFCLLAEKNDDGRLTVSPQLKRVRFLTYAQLNDRFMILTHFGVNNLGSSGLHPTGQSQETKLFLHDAWTEYRVWGEYLTIGTGLHYYNGLSRITNAGTLNFLTFDNYRQAWAQLGLSDQFGRHLGIFAKGRFGQLNYHFAINDPISNSIDAAPFSGERNTTAYVGRKYFPEKASRVYQGYVDYQFLDKESNKLPYRVGSYLGAQKVFNVGFGFFSHPDGVVRIQSDSTVLTQDVLHLAFDVYYDAPVSPDGALSLYGAFYKFDYGTDYCYKGIYGTGNTFYGQIGYHSSRISKSFTLLPYVAYSSRDYSLYHKNSDTYNFGTNIFINGHNAKFTLEYRTTKPLHNEIRPKRESQLILQTMVFL